MATYVAEALNNPGLFFNTVLYTGNAGTLNVTGVGFEPDWVWIKNRSITADWKAFDSVRGATKALIPNDAVAEITQSGLDSFDSDGFTLGSHVGCNGNDNSIASWNWKESATAGFDMVSYTGDGNSARTIAHSLSAVPSFLVYKNIASTDSWNVQHDGLTSYDYYVRFNSTGAQNNDVDVGPTAPTSSVVTVGSHEQQNEDGEAFILYAFAAKQGLSKFGFYTGNGNADGTFVYTGFRPAMVIFKDIDGTNSWRIGDTKRIDAQGGNGQGIYSFPNTSAVEQDATTRACDYLSNGFKIRHNDGSMNGSGVTYIYAAFAEAPFVNSNGVPCNAR